MKTREKIIATAVTLFNEKGSSAVSTNHIAEAAKISPGNLYYHFNNKDEIIRVIFEQMVQNWDGMWFSPPESELSLTGLKNRIKKSFLLDLHYAFFAREINSLLRADPLLRHRYEVIQEKRQKEQARFIQAFVEAGILQFSIAPNKLNQLLSISWVLSQYWIPFSELSNENITDEQIDEGVDLIMMLVEPYVKRSENGNDRHE
ncbi:TetR/AcrR family transcriptional regulator [Alkalihalobacterium bogoriense]|uniref:TetR/AcrR family transcriptional regulator n=1 Tax=Alkalihalobacterium bogoriense TaxID=246272 RepID=UPI000684662F|nr:TetR/AcrR family transcriptional regulator [Alkalihalobacterium bogoriense]